MKSLQLLTPARPCIFHCPFCIAQSHEHQNQFESAYEHNFLFWKQQLIRVLEQHPELKTVVITGTNEPLQDPECVEQMISIIRTVRPSLPIELQTRFYSPLPVMDLCDVVAYSIAHPTFLKNLSVRGKTSRCVILLTDAFIGYSLEEILSLLPKQVTQLTFKVLHDSNGVDPKMDAWITQHGMKDVTLLKKQIAAYQGPLSLFLDEFCMDAHDRYQVFREDGHLYSDYDSVEILL